MNKIMQFSVFMFLLATCITQATVNFELTNQTSRAIWICGYADDDIFTGTETLDCEKKILAGESFVANISNGRLDITIHRVDPRMDGSKPLHYHSKPSANDKDKILIWNPGKHPNTPLLPDVKKRFAGLVKAKIRNNITATEIVSGSYN